MTYLSVIGSPEVVIAGEKQHWRPRRLALLAYLALEGKQGRTPLSLLFFPQLSTEEARARLRVELHRLQHSPLGQMLHLAGDEVWVQTPCDLLEVRLLAQQQRWPEALARCQAPLLHGLELPDLPELADWLRLQRQDYEHLRAEAAQALILQLEGNGQREAALDWQRQRLRWQPLSEAASDALTERLVALGRRTEALEEQDVFRERFRQELGLEPELNPVAGAAPPVPVPQVTYSLLQPPLVGRDGLLLQLSEWLARSPAGALALLLGDGGVGKTRLARTFAQSVGGVTLLRGRAGGQHRPLAAVREALHAEAQAQQEAQQVTQHAPEEGQAGWPGLASGGGLAGETFANEARLLEAYAQALRQRVPVGVRLVRIEDAQWLDASSARVLLALQRREAARPDGVRFLLTSRPEGLMAAAPLAELLGSLDREVYLTQFEVPPLSEVSVLKLIRLLSGSPRATAFARTLHQLSGGNAYALLAFLQGLISRELISTASPEGWTLHVDLGDLKSHLPLTLQSLLEQTVRAAGAEVMTLLQASALLGQTFDPPAAFAGSGLEADQAQRAWGLALAHRWLHERESGDFRLEHDLLREALLKSLDRASRTQMHGRLAQYLEGAGAPTAQRALHWEGAGQRARALELWQEAAREASAVWAHQEALDALQHALDCAAEPADRIRLWRERGRIHQAIGALDAWEKELDDATNLQLRAQVPGEGLRLALEYTHLFLRSRRWQQALEISLPWVKGPVLEEAEYGLLLHDHAHVLIQLQRLEEAESLLRHTLATLGEKNQLLAANIYLSLFQIAEERQEFGSGLVFADRAVDLFRQQAQSAGLVAALNNKAKMHEMLGELDAAKPALQEAVALAQQAKLYRMFHYVILEMVSLCTKTHALSEAMAYATQGLEAAEAEGHREGIHQLSQRIAELAAGAARS